MMVLLHSTTAEGKAIDYIKQALFNFTRCKIEKNRQHQGIIVHGFIKEYLYTS